MSQNGLSTYVNSNVTSYVGQTASLPCWIPSSVPLSTVEWRRRDQYRTDQYVALSRDSHLDSGNQHPSFKDRARLKDKDMKDGNLALVLEDVEPADAGIYEARIKEGRPRRMKRAILSGAPVCIADLKVDSVQYITAHPGYDIILPCRAPRDVTVGAIEWSRTDLESEGYVFMVRDGIPDMTNQHPIYRNRVVLKDNRLKDGNLSLILRNVSAGDVGRYECRLIESGEREKRAVIKSDPVSIITLQVTDPVQYVTVHAGRNVTLPCRAPRDARVDALEWTRPDLEPKGYVFMVRDGIPDTTDQHPSYQNRVVLNNTRLKDGDLSLVLRNVTRSDIGTYECRLIRDGKREKKATIKSDPVSVIKLMVIDSGLEYEDSAEEEDEPATEVTPYEGTGRGRWGLIPSLGVLGVLVAVLGVLLFIP